MTPQVPGMAGLVANRIDQHMAAMQEQTLLLQAILNQTAGDPAQLALTDGAPGLALTKNFPYEGATRAILTRTPQAPHGVSGANGLLFDADSNRIGGQLVNKASAGLTLFLSDQARSATGTLWLAPNGGSWDFRLSGAVWCGNVFGVADTGNVNIAGASL